MKALRRPTLEQSKRRIRRALEAELTNGKWLYIGTGTEYRAAVRQLIAKLAPTPKDRRAKP